MKVSTVVTSDSFFDLLPSCYIMVSGLPQPAPLATVVCRCSLSPIPGPHSSSSFQLPSWFSLNLSPAQAPLSFLPSCLSCHHLLHVFKHLPPLPSFSHPITPLARQATCTNDAPFRPAALETDLSATALFYRDHIAPYTMSHAQQTNCTILHSTASVCCFSVVQTA